MDEKELNGLKIKLIRWVCDIEDETLLQQLIDILTEAEQGVVQPLPIVGF